jgi:ribonuclease HII
VFNDLISHKEIFYAVGVVGSDMIDEINILQATFLAMQKAIEGLCIPQSLSWSMGT